MAITQHDLESLPASVIKQRTVFHRQVIKFRELQWIYQLELNFVSPSPDEDVVEISLALPSSLPCDVRSKCSPKLVVMEKELCLGQCHDTLSSLRLHLHSRSRLLKDKYVNV